MYDFLVKKGLTMAFLVGVVITAVFLITATNGVNNAGLAGANLSEMKAEIPGMNFFNFGIYAALGLVVACFGLLLLFLAVDMVKFPKQMGKSLLAIIVLVVIFIALAMTSTPETGSVWDRLYNSPDFAFTPKVSQFVSGGLKTTALLIAGAVGIMIVSEIRNAFK